ncbi:DUF488 family protein [Luteimicrobium sp. NPDC057192]|uniref:DUF488 domain-containing protein n=1 Tax=Luteimicrobium sp. NPDC057192 TaxID=3346042 RepID=UPI00362A3F31
MATSDELWTIGHWTCPEDTFVGMLREAGVERVADVRVAPSSRRSPQFTRDVMREWLGHADVDYVHLPELGGHRPRRPEAGDLNAGWHNTSFRGYADYTLTPAYEDGVAHLLTLAAELPTVVLCAEPMPWRCHRLLIANTVAARGGVVQHVLGPGSVRTHELGRWGATPVHGDDGRLTYPADADPPRESPAA